MKVHKNTPTWAVNLVTQVCKDYNRTQPKQLVWWLGEGRWNGRTVTSSGNAGHGRIRISAGTDEQDQKLVLLHELAHHITQKRKPKSAKWFEGHSIRFWRLAFELYERYDMDMDYAYEREKDYMKKASQAYAEVQAKK